MMTDPIADMLTRIRNAIQAGHSSVVVPSSKLKLSLARILRDEGFVQNYDVIPGARPGGASTRQPQIRIWLRYVGERRDRKSVITGLRRVSKPGRRMYVGKSDIPWVFSGTGIAILSTSRGLLTDRQARRMGVGGEVMCYVW
jgi:small subunit ribosomal protein S8